MQQSDQLLITSLRDFISISPNIQVLSDIKTDQIFSICLNFLQTMSIDIQDIKSIQKQKFRSTTKLNQKLHKQLQIQLELNDLLNPTVTFIRKTLLIFLSKLGSNQNVNQKTLLGGQQDAQKRKQKKLLSNWIDDQWIHPNLITQNRPTYQAYLFPFAINRKSIKNNILPQLLNSSTKNNILSILTTSLNHNLMKQKQTQLNTGITKKKAQDNSTIQTGKLIAGNFEDWNMAQQKLNKIKRKIQKDKQNVQIAKKVQEQQKIKLQQIQQNQPLVVKSVFIAQVEQKIQQKEKQKQTKPQITISQTTSATSQKFHATDNPLQKLQIEAQQKKVHYQQMIQHLLVELNEKKQQSTKVSQKKVRLQTQIQKDEQKLVQYKTKTDQLKKQVQKKQLVLTAVESPKELQQQIKKFEEDIVTIEQQLKQQVQTTTQNIQTMKIQSDKKIQALTDLKMKLNRIQVEYKDVCEEIQEKTQRKGKIKINKSGISRNYYSKKISEIDKRWRQTQKQVQKIKRDLQIMKEKTSIITSASDSLEREVLNFMDADKNPKTQIEAKALKQVFVKTQNCFKTTLDTLNKINQIKEQTRQYEIKVHALTSQNYKQGIQKVNMALVQLKKQIQQMSKKQGVK